MSQAPAAAARARHYLGIFVLASATLAYQILITRFFSVMLYYHFMLAPTLTLTGALEVATYLLHYVAPILYLAWWALFGPHGSLQFRQIPLMLLPGIGYVAWVLERGPFAHEYPYDILDAGKFGDVAVAIGVGVLLVAVSIFSLVIVAADRYLAKRAAAGATW